MSQCPTEQFVPTTDSYLCPTSKFRTVGNCNLAIFSTNQLFELVKLVNKGKRMVSNNLGGPHGLGDPDDKTLRKVELEVMIPKLMRERAKTDKCVPEVKAFESCCKDAGLMMWYTCRGQNTGFQDCLRKWYTDDGFKAECTQVYLSERSEFRRTGISKKRREYMKAHPEANPI